MDEKTIKMKELSPEEQELVSRQIEEIKKRPLCLMPNDDPLLDIAKSLKSIDRTLKHIEEQMKKRKV